MVCLRICCHKSCCLWTSSSSLLLLLLFSSRTILADCLAFSSPISSSLLQIMSISYYVALELFTTSSTKTVLQAPYVQQKSQFVRRSFAGPAMIAILLVLVIHWLAGRWSAAPRCLEGLVSRTWSASGGHSDYDGFG